MTSLITYGTFDLFHFGHVELLRRMSDLCDHLTVACSTDEFNEIKNKSSIVSYEHRCQVLKSCRYVDDVIPEISWDQKKTDIVDLQIDIFCMGNDWAGEFDFLNSLATVIYLPRTKGVSSSEIKQQVLTRGTGF